MKLQIKPFCLPALVRHVSEQKYVLLWKQGKYKSDDCASNGHGQSKGRLRRELIISLMVQFELPRQKNTFNSFTWSFHLYDL